jgi:hypothetical protein
MKNLFKLVGMSLLLAVLFVFLYPPYYAWARLDEPMVIPEAQGMTLRAFYQDRRAAYEEAWENYGHELFESDNHVETAILQLSNDIGEWAVGSPVCGLSAVLLLPGYAGLLPAAQTYEEVQSGDISANELRDIWWKNVEYALWNSFALPRGGFTPIVCRIRPVKFQEQVAAGD